MKALPMFFGLVLIGLVITGATTSILAQDAAKVAPNTVKVVLDNDKVRVLDIQFKTGDKLQTHSHPAYVLYAVAGAMLKTTLADGKMTDTEFKAGETRWSDPMTHSNEALSDGHVIVVELKKEKATGKKDSKY